VGRAPVSDTKKEPLSATPSRLDNKDYPPGARRPSTPRRDGQPGPDKGLEVVDLDARLRRVAAAVGRRDGIGVPRHRHAVDDGLVVGLAVLERAVDVDAVDDEVLWRDVVGGLGP